MPLSSADIGMHWLEPFVPDANFDLAVEAEDMADFQENPQAREFFDLGDGSISPDGSVIVGKDGHLFIYDGSNQWKGQLRGDIAVSPRDLEQAVGTLTSIDKECRRRDIAFRFTVTPEKDIVYQMESPSARGGVSDKRTIQRYIDALPFPIIYPLAQLKWARSLLQVYHRRDSHYNFFGGLIVANAVLEGLGRPSLTRAVLPVRHAPTQDDLSLKWLPLPMRRRLLSPPLTEDTLVAPASHMGLHLRLRQKQPSTSERAVIFGDSYSWNPDAGLFRFLGTQFEETHFVWKKTIDWDLVDCIRPSVMILQSAERFLVRGIG